MEKSEEGDEKNEVKMDMEDKRRKMRRRRRREEGERVAKRERK